MRIAPVVGLVLADDHAEQRGLAGAVRPDHADDAARRQLEGEVVDEQAVAIAFLEMLGLDDDVAEARARRNDDLRLAGLVASATRRAVRRRRWMRALDFAWRAFGLALIQSSSRASVRSRASSCLPSTAPRFAFCSSQHE